MKRFEQSLLAAAILAAFLAPAAPAFAQHAGHAVVAQAPATAKVAETGAALRDLWLGHAFWVRNVAVDTFAGNKAAAAAGEVHATDEAGLWALLVCVARRKCHRQADRFFAGRRDVRREGPLADASAPSLTEEEVCARDLLECLRAGLNSARKRQILDLTLQGYSVPEISARAGYYERGVEREHGWPRGDDGDQDLAEEHDDERRPTHLGDDAGCEAQDDDQDGEGGHGIRGQRPGRGSRLRRRRSGIRRVPSSDARRGRPHPEPAAIRPAM